MLKTNLCYAAAQTIERLPDYEAYTDALSEWSAISAELERMPDEETATTEEELAVWNECYDAERAANKKALIALGHASGQIDAARYCRAAAAHVLAAQALYRQLEPSVSFESCIALVIAASVKADGLEVTVKGGIDLGRVRVEGEIGTYDP